MKKLMSAIDKFCLTHRRFGIPKLILYIIIGYGAVFLVAMMDRTGSFLSLLLFSPSDILRGEIWRLVTWVFIPSFGGSSLTSLFLAAVMLYFYYFIGMTLEREWGTPKFNIYYLTGVILNILYGFLAWLVTGATPYLDSNYLNMSMFFTFAVFYPDQRVLFFFIIPMKIKWLAWFDAAYFAIMVAVTAANGYFVDALVPVVAVLNFFIFCGSDLIGYMRPMRAHATRQAINFRRAARHVRHEEASKPYRHKCAVCGRTDADYPNLEFRYCSRCNGYHCFCSDHINNHIHFK